MPEAKELIELLRQMHSPERGWVFLDELRIGTGYGGKDREQRLDAWAINTWPSHGAAPNLRRAFEVKVSKADVRAELLNPDKRWLAYTLSHEFWFVAPEGVIDVTDLDRTDGLLVLGERGLEIRKVPLLRPSAMPRWNFVAALARRVIDTKPGGG